MTRITVRFYKLRVTMNITKVCKTESEISLHICRCIAATLRKVFLLKRRKYYRQYFLRYKKDRQSGNSQRQITIC